MASFGSGFSNGFRSGVDIGERWKAAEEKKFKEETQGKLFQIANTKQALDAEGNEYANIMDMVGKASIGDIQKALADSYIASGEKMDAKTYNVINKFSQGIFDVKEKAVGYNERRSRLDRDRKMFELNTQNINSQMRDREEKRKLFAQKNANDSEILRLNMADKQYAMDERKRKARIEQNEKMQKTQQSYDGAMDGINLIDSLIEDKGRAGATGWQSMFPTTAGSSSADFEAKVKTLTSKNFMNQIQNMRGMGALSDAEGKKVSDAIASLDISQSDEGFKNQLESIKASYQRLVKYSEQEAKSNGYSIDRQGEDQTKDISRGHENRTIVRTGTSNGRKVVQYSDGSIEYAD